MLGSEEMNDDGLRERIRGVAKPPHRKKNEWVAPRVDEFAEKIRVLCFDQSVNNTGVVMLWADYGRVTVWSQQTLVPDKDPDLFSVDRIIQRAVSQDEFIREAICEARADGKVDAVVVERTPLEGYRTESSLLASFSIHRLAPEILGVPVTVVANNHAKAVMLAPNRRSEKIHTKDLLDRYRIPGRWNEHTRDALLLGLTHLYDVKKDKENE